MKKRIRYFIIEVILLVAIFFITGTLIEEKYAYGRYDFSQENISGLKRLVNFSVPESGGRWTDGTPATVVFSKNLPDEFILEINIRETFGDAGKNINLQIGSIARVLIPSKNGDPEKIKINNCDCQNQISIMINSLVSPFELGISDDKRKLGIFIKSIAILRTDQ